MKYNAEILVKFATKLNSQADTVVANWTIGLTMLGGGIGFIFGEAIKRIDPIPVAMVFACVFLAIGYNLGKSKALEIRVKAHQILCGVEQERHLAVIAGRRDVDPMATERA